MNEKENTTYQNLWETAKAVLGGNFIVIMYPLRKRKPQNNNISTHLKSQENKRAKQIQSKQKEGSHKDKNRNQ